MVKGEGITSFYFVLVEQQFQASILYLLEGGNPSEETASCTEYISSSCHFGGHGRALLSYGSWAATT
ncbi:unnamed protein product [Urochloa humidicola]